MSNRPIFVERFGEDVYATSFKPHPPRESITYPGSKLRGEVDVIIIYEEQPLTLPARDLTRQEYETWRGALKNVVRRYKQNDLLSAYGLEGACVDVSFKAIDTEQFRTLLEATVTNIGCQPLGAVQLLWNGQWDTPIVEKGTGFPLGGRGWGFRGGAPFPFPSGESRKFALLKPELTYCLNYAAMLSPQQYWITIEAQTVNHPAFHEIDRIRGEQLGEIVDELNKLIETEPDN